MKGTPHTPLIPTPLRNDLIGQHQFSLRFHPPSLFFKIDLKLSLKLIYYPALHCLPIMATFLQLLTRVPLFIGTLLLMKMSAFFQFGP